MWSSSATNPPNASLGFALLCDDCDDSALLESSRLKTALYATGAILLGLIVAVVCAKLCKSNASPNAGRGKFVQLSVIPTDTSL